MSPTRPFLRLVVSPAVLCVSTARALRPTAVNFAAPAAHPARARFLRTSGLRCSSSAASGEVPHLIADIQVLPSPPGTPENEFEHVEAAIAAIASSGLDHTVNALGTTVEGPPDEVWAAARAAFDACLASGASSEMMYLKVYQGERTIAQLQTSGRAAASAAVAAAAAATNEAAAPNAPAADASDAVDPAASAPDEPDDYGPMRTTVIHAGSRELPPLIEVPGGALLLQRIVKPPDAEALWEWESNRGNLEADPSWASVWPAAANLAYLLQRNASLVQGRRVAELGAGLGVAGLSAALCGAKSVTLLDREPLALHCAMSTAAVCGLPTGPVPDGSAAAASAADGEVSASVADWGRVAEGGLVVDVVLASEVLYDPDEAAPLARGAAALLANGGTLLLADPEKGRATSARAVAAEALVAMGARVDEEPLVAPPAGDGWYALRAGDGRGDAAQPSERVVLLTAVFDGPPKL